MRQPKGFVSALAVLATAAWARVAPADTTLQSCTYGGGPAFRLSDGRTEAVVVPELGRVMRFGFVAGFNWLWNSRLDAAGTPPSASGWLNWGGDKTWPAPQTMWLVASGRGWPPDAAWDAQPHVATVQPGNQLRMESPVSAFSGARIVRTFGFNADGGFEINQTIEKVQGPVVELSIWSVTQVEPPTALFLPTTPTSLYRDNFAWLSLQRPHEAAHPLIPSLLKMLPSASANYKVGSDAPTAAIAAVRGDIAFVERGAYDSQATYPDAPNVATELYNNSDRNGPYLEMELQSPLQPYYPGTAHSYRVTWSLDRLPSPDLSKPANLLALQRLLR